MPQPRQSPSTGRIEPPTAYSRFDDKARNEWIDSLKENIRRGLHPEASPGPSRSPSPYEVTQNAIFAAEVQTLSTEQVAEAGTEDDELFNEEGDDEEVAIDEDEIRELEVDYPPITSVDPDEEADSRNDDLRHGNLADHSGKDRLSLPWRKVSHFQGYQTYAEDGYEVNDGEYDKDEGDEEDDRSLRSGDEDEGDDEVQYIGSSDEEPIAQVAGAAEEEDEENKDYENDADKDKAEVYYEGQEEEGYEGEHQPRSIYPTLPGQEVDGYQESEMEEEDFLDNERSPLHHLVCSDHMGSAVQDPYQTQNIYPRLDTFPPSLPVPSSSAITPFADHPDVVNFSENLIDPALLTDIAQQAAEALRAPSGSEARVMVDAAEEEYDERMATEEGEAVGRREYTTPSDGEPFYLTIKKR